MIHQQCQGCGAQIQTSDKDEYGFVPEALLERKPLLCQRCFRINHYGLDELGPVQAEDSLASIQAGLKWANSIVLVLDLMDFEAGLPADLLALCKRKPLILAVNKVDLLPEQTPLPEVETWLVRRLIQHGLARAEINLVSAASGYGFPALADSIEKLGKNVLFAGVTNVGKSSVIQRLLQMRLGGGQKGQVKPTISPYPGTTVQVSKWKCPAGLVLADSPGYVPQGRISDLVRPNIAKDLIPHQRLSSHLYPFKQTDLVFIAGLCGIECLEGSDAGVVLGFTGSGVKWQKSNKRHKQKWLQDEGKRTGIEKWAEKVIKLDEGQDLVISGLGWISTRKSPFKVRVHYPEGALLTVRENLIGKKKR